LMPVRRRVPIPRRVFYGGGPLDPPAYLTPVA
jgi:hypothetical protein